jgi:delta14-sterol reductase
VDRECILLSRCNPLINNCYRIGALAVTLGCPFLAYSLLFICNDFGCPSQSFLEAPLETFKAQWPGWEKIYSTEVFGYYCAWYLGLVALQFILPGKEILGVPLRDGSRLKYKINGQ